MLKQISFLKLHKIIIHGKSSWRLLLGAVISVAFSQSVILSTIGLMDGFDYALKNGLKNTSGDLKVTTTKGFFELKQDEMLAFENQKISQITQVIQSEGYLISENGSKGVLVKGVEPISFNLVTGLNLNLESPKDIILGKELALEFKLTPGDEVAVTFAKGSRELKGAPLLETFIYKASASHGIYEKDLRFIYIQKDKLAEILGSQNKVNSVLAKTNLKNIELDELAQVAYRLEDELGYGFKVKPFWSEFSGIIKAVQVEKFSLSFILQIIVIVAIFNIAAFIIFITEKKAQDFFLLRSIGLNQKSIAKFWFKLTFSIWFLASILGVVFTYLFSWIIQKLEVIKGLRSIYFVENIELILRPKDFAIVFGLTFIWMILISFIGIIKISKKPILVGLRQELS